ncbi:MAG: cysteinyl-tRNA synthetase [Sphingomonas bacterium]|jgi:cysteinyl-tRNA synthetase|nr:cysteine--tRNA ligase [Sphingomonas bacterium]MDB5688981.1 cysteinyl-tRNA synthetase [Sphingomonas bacterium]
MTDSAPLVLFNSLTRAAEPFVPIDPAAVRVYSCGPTVYARQHLGNMRAYVFTDTLTRVLRWKGWPVRHVINITDVGHLTSDADAGDDKIEKAAAAEQVSAWDVAARYTALFKADLARLNVAEPTRWSVATDHIDDMIAFAGRIGGSTYEAPSGLYFDTTTVPDYGKLAGHREDAAAPDVARIDSVEGKRHPADFAIWRKSEEPGRRQMEWASPWGIGAPGWHLECSVMSMKYLGAQFDIHTGGIDHREIHHPNEIAQNQAYTGTAGTGANLWMHNNFLVERGAKMSKSSGGFATLDTLVDAGVHPLAYRMLCLSAHYRSELEFSAENVLAALTRLKRLVIALAPLRAAATPSDSIRHPKLTEQLGLFDAAVANDLNTAAALTHLDAAITAKRIDAGERLAAVARMDEVLGLGLLALERSALRVRPATATLTDDEVEALLAERKAARAAKDFAAGDAIRDTLMAAGVDIMDGDALGWDWRPRFD